MKTIRFLGIKGQTKARGCSSCGRRHVTSDRFEHIKKMYLPSGRIETFAVGIEYIVSDMDADFLTSFSYVANGKVEHPFIYIGNVT